MLKDTVRTLSYKNAIMQNPHLFKDKVVLDVSLPQSIVHFYVLTALVCRSDVVPVSCPCSHPRLEPSSSSVSICPTFSVKLKRSSKPTDSRTVSPTDCHSGSDAYETARLPEIVLIKGKLEEVTLPVEKVDIIISEVSLGFPV